MSKTKKFIQPPTKCKLWEKPELVLDIFPWDDDPNALISKHYKIIDDIWHDTDSGYDSIFILKCKECGQYYYYNYYEDLDGHYKGTKYLAMIPAYKSDLKYTKELKFSDFENVLPRLECKVVNGAIEKPKWKGKDELNKNNVEIYETVVNDEIKDIIKKRKEEDE